MPEGTSPAQEGPPEVTNLPRAVDPDAVVVHPDPVRIPISALPLPSRPRLRGSTFSTTFVIGVSAAPWFAAAFITGARVAVIFAACWGVVLALNLVVVFRRR
jgi:hypothetical protein